MIPKIISMQMNYKLKSCYSTRNDLADESPEAQAIQEAKKKQNKWMM